MIRIKTLQLHNFRCFENCEISFQPDLTVLVARNGQGKTALLDAVALAIGLFVDTVAGMSQWRGFSKRDVRRVRAGEQTIAPQGYVEFQAEADIDGHQISWRRWMRSDAKRAVTSTKDTTSLTGVGANVKAQLDVATSDAPNRFELPLVAYYGTGRRWSDNNTQQSKRSVAPPSHPRCLGYVDCLNSTASYGLFVSWYEENFIALGKQTHVVGIQKADRPERLIAAVNQAVNDVLEPETGWRELFWDQDDGQLILQHPDHGQLPLDFLSDGVRTTVALVADVAHRCARLNPHLGEDAARHTSGLLLIDEIDLHLHPEWQQSIVRMLRTAFPNLQIILSTHSPQVLSTVEAKSIRLIELRNGVGDVDTPSVQTQGVKSSDVMAKLMDVDPRPDIPPTEWLSNYRALVQVGDQESPNGQELWTKLINHFGDDHPLLIELDTVRRLQDFKRANNIPLS